LPIFLHLTSIFEHERGEGKGEGEGCVGVLVGAGGEEGGCDTGWPQREQMFRIGLISE
jgi:hypothetical protein